MQKKYTPEAMDHLQRSEKFVPRARLTLAVAQAQSGLFADAEKTLTSCLESPEEPPLPEEAGSLAAQAAQAPSRPVEASPGAVLNVRFARGAGQDRVVSAMQAFKVLLRERPGGTRVVVHVPAPGGSALPMELRGVAYDAELVAEVRRRVGDGVIDLQLG